MIHLSKPVSDSYETGFGFTSQMDHSVSARPLSWQQKVNYMDGQRQYITVYSNQQTHMGWHDIIVNYMSYIQTSYLPGTITTLM